MSKKPKNEDISPDGGYKVKTYNPTLEEMKDFSAYIKKIHEDGGHKAGLAKIIPPVGFVARKVGYGDDKLYDMDITNPIKQKNSGQKGVFQQFNIVEKKKISVRNFKKLAEDKYPTPIHRTHEDLERIFWKNIFTQPSIYGADVSGSLFDDDVEEFNLTKLNTILDKISDDYGVTIQGVNTAYLYFGMWKTSFSWHTEDMDLYSINYLHEGAPKSWYCISSEHGKRFERLAEMYFPHSFKTCKAFLRHKTTLISPQVLRTYGIPFSKCTQSKGEFMITFPYSYHSGYNHGFNIAEATNFALEYWIDFGKWATRCECSSESVKISMQTFVKNYQPERYENWLQGKDVCPDPREPHKQNPAPKPTEYDLYLMGTHIRSDDGEQEEEKIVKNNALQQNQSSNFKIKTKAARKAYPTFSETYQKYSEFLMQSDNQNRYDNISTQLTHYSPIPNQMQRIDHQSLQTTQDEDRYFEFVPRNTLPFIGSNALEEHKKLIKSKEIPDYKKELAKLESKKRKKEEKAKKRREKRMKSQMIPPKELLQFLPVTFTHEKRFNRWVAALEPHCSICQILVPFPKEDESKVEEFKLPETSSVLLPRGVFNRYSTLDLTLGEDIKTSDETQTTNNNSDDSGYIAKDNLDFMEINLESSELLQCSVCMLCVHKLCYGINTVPTIKADWICDRCKLKNRSSVVCELCPCRGGAIKEYKGTWMHISCALTIPDISYIDIIKPEKSPTKKIVPLENLSDNGKCLYCISNSSLPKYVQGRCVPCQGKYYQTPETYILCENKFHSTCGHRNGAEFDYSDIDPGFKFLSLCSTCKNHYKTVVDEVTDDKKDKNELYMIKPGTKVIARASNNQYYVGLVDHYRIVTHYSIYFPQKSEVEGAITSDRIVDFNENIKYRVGDKVLVKDKDEIREGKFKSQDDIEEYYIVFDTDPGQLDKAPREKVKRSNIYINLDQMPKELFDRYHDVLSSDSNLPGNEKNNDEDDSNEENDNVNEKHQQEEQPSNNNGEGIISD